MVRAIVPVRATVPSSTPRQRSDVAWEDTPVASGDAATSGSGGSSSTATTSLPGCGYPRAQPLREGSQLAVSGYALNQPSLVTNAGVLACTLSSEVRLCDMKVRHLADFTAHPGNSGGPVFSLQDGAVIGVCVSGRLAPVLGRLTVIVPAVDVIAMLDRNGLTATVQPG